MHILFNFIFVDGPRYSKETGEYIIYANINLSASESRRRSADTASLTGTTTDNTLMHSGFDAVEHLQVQFRELVFLVSGGFLDITEGRGIDDVADNESLDGLILGDSLSSGNASHTLDVSATVLVSSVVTSLDSHDEVNVSISCECYE